MNKKIAFTQGRIYGSTTRQNFPKRWKKEIIDADKIGINKIEWIFDKDYKKNPLNTKIGDIEIKNFFKKNNTIISSLCLDNYLDNKFTFDKKNKKFLIKIIDICTYYNIKIIVIPLFKSSDIKFENLIKNSKWFLSFNKLLKLNKILLSLETCLNPLQNFLIMKKFNSKYIGLTYDIGNSSFFGFNQKYEIELLKKFINHVHIKDSTPKKYSTKFGEGNSEFKILFNSLKKKRYNGYYVLQGYRLKNNLLALKQQINFINKFI